jgi:excisionase family DNA binding protein
VTEFHYLSPREVAAQLGISRRDVYRILINLPRVRLGRRIRVAEHELAAYLAKKTVQPWQAESTDAARPARTGQTGPTPMGSATSEACERPTRKSRENDSVDMSWLRPLKREGGGKSSPKRSVT